MRYWWVNQKQTHKYEISHNFMWSPKRNKNGAKNRFYDNMRDVAIGDVVFSYYGQRLRHIGRVAAEALPIPKPLEFAQPWDTDGWYVPVEWHHLDDPIEPRSLMAELRPLLPSTHSPLQRDSGKGLQGVYLAELSADAANVLIAAGGKSASAAVAAPVNHVSSDEALQKAELTVEVAIEGDPSLSATEKMDLRLARRGQGKFRKSLMTIEKSCRVTGVTDERLLVASHIKPWSVCTNSHERLDGANGLLLARHIDHLFDNGWITFTDDGKLKLSSRISGSEYEKLGLRSIDTDVGSFSDRQKVYLSYHRTIFKA